MWWQFSDDIKSILALENKSANEDSWKNAHKKIVKT